MINLSLFKRHQNKVLLRHLRALSESFAILADLEQRGMFHFHPKEKALLIEESFARIELAKGREGFHNFLDKVKDYQNYHLLQQAYDKYVIKRQTEALREAIKKCGTLTKADEQRIKQHARDTLRPLNPSSIITPAYWIYIIRADAPSSAQALDTLPAKGENSAHLVAVGHYDGNTLEMSLYEDVKQRLTTQEQ